MKAQQCIKPITFTSFIGLLKFDFKAFQEASVHLFILNLHGFQFTILKKAQTFGKCPKHGVLPPIEAKILFVFFLKQKDCSEKRENGLENARAFWFQKK
jgi:hypothetical protein